jgi:hypothetical protein
MRTFPTATALGALALGALTAFNDTLTIKVSGTTFKYIGNSPSWTKEMGSTIIPMLLAEAIYTPGSGERA